MSLDSERRACVVRGLLGDGDREYGGGDEGRTTNSSKSAGYVWLHHPCLLRVPIVRRVQYGGWKLGKNG